jgi:hypothetical protein
MVTFSYEYNWRVITVAKVVELDEILLRASMLRPTVYLITKG